MEANDNKYFIEGFLLKHFDIWPYGLDKNDLFPEQKIFLIYLMACIPSIENWTIEVEYREKVERIKSETRIKLTDEEIDVALLQGKDIEEIKRDRLINEKLRLIKELNNKYGIIEIETAQTPEGLPEKIRNNNPPEKLWELLHGKGLVKNGLQDKN